MSTAVQLEREVVKCVHCALVQFAVASGICRRCRQSVAVVETPAVPVAVMAPEDLKLHRVWNPELERAEPEVPMTTAQSREEHGSPWMYCRKVYRVDVAFALALLRSLEGWSQHDMADRFGWKRTYLSKIENYRVMPSLRNIAKIAACFDLSARGFMEIATAEVKRK